MLASLQKQVTDQGSRLRSGVFTSKVLSLTADDDEIGSDHAIAFEDLDDISAPGSCVHFVCVHCDSSN